MIECEHDGKNAAEVQEITKNVLYVDMMSTI